MRSSVGSRLNSLDLRGFRVLVQAWAQKRSGVTRAHLFVRSRLDSKISRFSIMAAATALKADACLG